MLNNIYWRQTVYDPRFWAVRYERFPGVMDEESLSYFHEFYHLEESGDVSLVAYVGDERNLQPSESTSAIGGLRMLSIPFPENYTWKIEFTTEDGHADGIYHSLFHPSIDPKGITLAEEGGHESLPGLRWTELKQIENCLTRYWQGDGGVKAVVPLLYPVVKWITFDDLHDVLQAFTTAWKNLQVLTSSQTEQWLDDSIHVYDHGWVLHLDENREWKPLSIYKHALYNQEPLWRRDENGWQTLALSSRRYIKKDVHQLLPFFSMLERYS